jgi:hypothetical protein
VGTGSRVLRALIIASLGVAGCIDFVEPDLPERGAPAVVQLTLRLLETGTTEVDGRLVPGLDDAGVPRRVTDARFRVLGRDLAPDSTLKSGTRVYRTDWPGGATDAAGAIEARGPDMEGLSSPAIRWYALRRGGSASVAREAGTDLQLTVDVTEGTATPEPEIRWWFLTLSDTAGAFRLGGDGAPPDTIVVPARWVPAGDSVAALLIYQQSARIESLSERYVGLFTLDARVSWVVRRAAPAGGEN